MTPQPGSEPWMPNGFPPPSFVVETERTTTTFAGPRGRWLAAAAILGALLLIAGVVVIVNQGDDSNNTALKAGATTTTAAGNPSPSFTSSTPLDPTATLPTATTSPGGAVGPGGTAAPGGGGTTVAPVTTAAPGRSAPPGVLTPSITTVTIPRVDSTAGTQTGRVSLRNTGGSPLDYTTRTNFAGLTLDKPTGTIAPGASTDVTITLNGGGAAEGPFTGSVSFDGSGGSKQIAVTSTVGRPPQIADAGEPCPTETTTCNKQVKLENTNVASPTPCNTRWSYRVNVSDESQLKAVRADLSADVELRINGAASGPGGIWQSAVFDPVPAGTTVAYTIEAVDQLDLVRRSTDRKIVCP